MLGGRIWHMRRAAVTVGLVAMFVLALASCEGAVPVNPGGPRQPAAPTPSGTAVVCVSPVCAAADVQVFVEPDAGEAPLLHAIEYATHSISVEVYLLTDHTLARALEDAARRCMAVRVLLEAHPFGGGDVSAARTIEELNAAGVQAQPALMDGSRAIQEGVGRMQARWSVWSKASSGASARRHATRLLRRLGRPAICRAGSLGQAGSFKV